MLDTKGTCMPMLQNRKNQQMEYGFCPEHYNKSPHQLHNLMRETVEWDKKETLNERTVTYIHTRIHTYIHTYFIFQLPKGAFQLKKE